jgi:hypothetical protein
MEITQVNNLSNEIYHDSEQYKEHWSSSNLKEYLKTPREAYYQKYVASNKNTDAFQFGNQLHDFLASKHINGQPFEWNIFEPPINLKTGKYYGTGTQAYADALAQIENPISSNDMELINDIWDMIRRSNYAWYFEQEILGKGIAEPSFFVDGLHKYKYRPDVLTDKYIFDYKSVDKRYWHIDKLNYRMLEFGYDISAAMYQYFEHQRTGTWKPFIIVWIMKDPPFDILISNISQYCYEDIGNGEVVANSGANVFKKLKDQHELCQVSKCWPGIANQFDEFGGIRLPEFSPRYDRGYDEFEID